MLHNHFQVLILFCSLLLAFSKWYFCAFKSHSSQLQSLFTKMKLILYKNQILCMNMSDFIVFFLSLYTHRASQ